MKPTPLLTVLLAASLLVNGWQHYTGNPVADKIVLWRISQQDTQISELKKGITRVVGLYIDATVSNQFLRAQVETNKTWFDVLENHQKAIQRLSDSNETLRAENSKLRSEQQAKETNSNEAIVVRRNTEP